MKKDTFIYYLKKYLIIILGLGLPFLLRFIMYLLNFPSSLMNFLFFVLIIVIPLTFVNIFKDYSKYGNKIFKVGTNNYSEIEFLAKEIEKIDTYQKVIIKDNKIIVINSSGVFEFILFNKKGFLKGNIMDDIWYLNDEKIENPFVINDKFKHNYFIVNGMCLFKTDAKLVSKTNIYFEILKCLNKPVYDNSKIDELYEVLNGYNKD